MFGLTSKQRNATKMVCYSELTSSLMSAEIKPILILDNMGFYSGVKSGIRKIGLKSHKTLICCHPNSSAASGTYVHMPD